MKKNCTLILFLVLGICATQGSTIADSLERVLQDLTDPQERVKALTKLAYLKRVEAASANHLLDEAEALANQHDLKQLLYEVYVGRFAIPKHEGSLQTDKETLNKMIQLNKSLKSTEVEARIDYFKADAFHDSYQFDSAVFYALSAYNLLTEIRDSSLLILSNIQLGTIHMMSEKFDLANDYYSNAQRIAAATGNSMYEVIGLWHLLDNAKNWENTDRILEYGELLARKQPGMLFGNDGLGAYHSTSIFFDVSEHPTIDEVRQLESIWASAKENNQLYMESILLRTILNGYESLQRVDLAIPFTKRYIELARMTDEPFDEIYAQNLRIEFFYNSGKYKAAVDAMEEKIRILDTTRLEQFDRDLAELRLKFETAEREKEIALLENENLAKQASMDRLSKRVLQRNAIIAILASLVFALFFGIRFYSLRAKANKVLAQKNEEIATRRLAALEKEKQITYMNAMIEGQEAERSRIASELHDGLGGLLSTASRFLEQGAEGTVDRKFFRKATDMVQNAYEEARDLSHSMMPGALVRFGLVQAIDELVKTARMSSGLSIHFETVNMEERLSKTTESMIYRIVQECLNNIIKHAEASDIMIQLARTNSRIHLTIEDDGKGFDLESARSKKSIGLQSIEARVSYLRGTLNIGSQPGGGTTIEVVC